MGATSGAGTADPSGALELINLYYEIIWFLQSVVMSSGGRSLVHIHRGVVISYIDELMGVVVFNATFNIY